jgi:hypothetical protein
MVVIFGITGSDMVPALGLSRSVLSLTSGGSLAHAVINSVTCRLAWLGDS